MLRRRLVLGVLVRAPRDWKTLRDAVERDAADLDMQVEVDRGRRRQPGPPRGPQPRHRARHAAARPAAMAAIAGRIADTGANIDRIERMARYPVTAIDLHVSGADPDRLRGAAGRGGGRARRVDVAVQPANLLRRGMRLIVMDVDSTLVQGEVIEMLAAHAGCGPRSPGSPRRRCAASSTSRSRCAARVALLEGLDASALDQVYDEIVLAPGARTLVRTLQAARLPVRDRLRRLHPDHRPARRRPRHRLRRAPTSSRSSTAGSPAGSSGDVVDRAGKADGAAPVRRRGGRARGRR